METEIKRALTADEIAVLRELVRWRRNHDVQLAFGGGWHLPDGGLITWLNPRSYATCMKVGVTADRRRDPIVWYRVRSVAQAVDMLVVLGYLPPRFSSAYRAGWNAAMTWEHCEDNEAQFRALFHDPDNISFPAGDPTW